jgi:hypothetical protein
MYSLALCSVEKSGLNAVALRTAVIRHPLAVTYGRNIEVHSHGPLARRTIYGLAALIQHLSTHLNSRRELPLMSLVAEALMI